METGKVLTSQFSSEYLKNKKIAVKSCHGTFLAALQDGGGKKIDLKDQIDEWEMFTLIFHSDNLISLQTFHGTFLRAWPKILLQSNDVDTQTKIEAWEKWKIIPLSEDKFAFQSWHNTFISAHSGSPTSKISLEKSIQKWEIFELILVNNKATLEDVEFHFNNAKIISKKTVPLYETILKNNSKTEQANDFNFETEVKTWSEWKQNGGELLINKTKIKFRKPFFKNGSLCYANLELIDADLQKKEGIIEKLKLK